ncbi:MAG: TolC family outer membrane protein [Rhizobacter sp.]|nr:TolC family outer membrane protein [Rhizobacter sp.]
MFPKRSRAAKAALAVALALGGLHGAQAQSLQAVYDAAHVYDATYLAARALARSAEYRAAQVEAPGRPTLSATAGASTAQNDYPKIGASDIAARQATLNGRYPLFNRANSATIDQARRQLDSAFADLDSAEQDLIVRAAQTYFDVLAAQDTLATTRANKAAITETLASAKRNFEVGTATITDTREAQARFDLATALEIAADNDLLTKRIALDQLVGGTGIVPQPLRVPVLLPTTVPANAEEWVGVADTQHPAVLRARVALDVAQFETKKAKAAALPTLDAVASLGASYSRGVAVSLPGTTQSASLGVQMNWPLYTGGATQNRIKETLVLEDKSRNDLDAARRGVAQTTRVAYFAVQSGVAQVKALEAAEASSKLALQATQLGYKVGVRVNLDVLNAQTQLFQTQRDLAKARYDVLVGSLRLRQASGRLTPEDLAATNRLLQP